MLRARAHADEAGGEFVRRNWKPFQQTEHERGVKVCFLAGHPTGDDFDDE